MSLNWLLSLQPINNHSHPKIKIQQLDTRTLIMAHNDFESYSYIPELNV
jgi:hypothetical protein